MTKEMQDAFKTIEFIFGNLNTETLWSFNVNFLHLFLVAYCNSSNRPPWSVSQSVSPSHFFVTQPFYYNLKCFISEYPVISGDISGYLVVKYFQS